jgi:hypothetical protein
MAHRTIETLEHIAEFARFLEGQQLPITVEWVKGRDRTRDQNALQFLWASEISQQLGDQTIDEVRHSWKLRHGVPILRESSQAFREVYDKAIKPLPYELKIAAMAFIPVTSEMKVRQMVAYLDAIQRECAQQGLRLTDPDPLLAKYQERYRPDEISY